MSNADKVATWHDHASQSWKWRPQQPLEKGTPKFEQILVGANMSIMLTIVKSKERI